MSIVRVCLCFAICFAANQHVQSFEGSIDALLLQDVSVAPATGPGGALLEPTLDGGFYRKDDKFGIQFPCNQSYFGHRGVRIGDLLPFFGYHSANGYYKVVGWNDAPGFVIESIKTPKGFPNVDGKKNLVWIDGWSSLAGTGVLSLASHKDSDRVSFKLHDRRPDGSRKLLAQGDLKEGAEFRIRDRNLRILKIYPGDKKSRRIGFIEYVVQKVSSES